jgi:hypothetical protein
MDNKTKQEIIEKFELLDNASNDEQAYWDAFYNAFETVFVNIADMANFHPICERQDFKFFGAVIDMRKKADAVFLSSGEESSLFKQEKEGEQPPFYTPTNADMHQHLKAFIAGYDERSFFADCALELLKDLIMKKDMYIVDENGVWNCEGIRTRGASVATQTKSPILRTMIDPATGGLSKTMRKTTEYIFSHGNLAQHKADIDRTNAIMQWFENLGQECKQYHEIPRIIAALCDFWFELDDLPKATGKNPLERKAPSFAIPIEKLYERLTGNPKPYRQTKERILNVLQLIRFVRYPNGKTLEPFIWTSFDPKKEYLNVNLSAFSHKHGYFISPVQNVYKVTDGQSDEYRAFSIMLALRIANNNGNKGYPFEFTYKEIARQTGFKEWFMKKNIENVLGDLQSVKVIQSYEKFEAPGKPTHFKLTPCINTHRIPNKF